MSYIAKKGKKEKRGEGNKKQREGIKKDRETDHIILF